MFATPSPKPREDLINVFTCARFAWNFYQCYIALNKNYLNPKLNLALNTTVRRQKINLSNVQH